MILIDRLKGGRVQKIDEQLEAGFLGPDEPELKFHVPVAVVGEAYLTDEHLIIHLKAQTKASMPCAVCNKMIEVDLAIENFYHTEAIEGLEPKFDYRGQLRENLLIELPRTVECNHGKCPGREMLSPYLKSKKQPHFPFADIDKNHFLGE